MAEAEVKRLRKELKACKDQYSKLYEKRSKDDYKITFLEHTAFRQKKVLDDFYEQLEAKDAELKTLKKKVEQLESEGGGKDAVAALEAAENRAEKAEREKEEVDSKLKETVERLTSVEAKVEELEKAVKERNLKLEALGASLCIADVMVEGKELRNLLQTATEGEGVGESEEEENLNENEGRREEEDGPLVENEGAAEVAATYEVQKSETVDRVLRTGRPKRFPGMPQLEREDYDGVIVLDENRPMPVLKREVSGNTNLGSVKEKPDPEPTSSLPVMRSKRSSSGSRSSVKSSIFFHSPDSVKTEAPGEKRGSSWRAQHLRLKSRPRHHHQNQILCWLCHIRFRSGKELHKHVLKRHGADVTSEKYGWCRCGEMFSTLRQVMRHNHIR